MVALSFTDDEMILIMEALATKVITTHQRSKNARTVSMRRKLEQKESDFRNLAHKVSDWMEVKA